MAASDLPAGVTKLGEFQGAKGDKGSTGTFASATASTLPAGSQATVQITGPEDAKGVAFGIPRGDTGAPGSTGPAGTITSATASGVAAGAAPTITLGGTSTARTLAFGIPAGIQGIQGIQGPKGDTGAQGPAAPAATTTIQGLVELATQAESDAGAAGVVPTAATVKASFDAWELLRRPLRPFAVFIGASNVVTGTWPEKLSTAEGWQVKNFAVAGHNIATNQFNGQIDAAIADASFANADVGFVFYAGGGNDIRADATSAGFTTSVNADLAKIRASFPNARVIVVPALWGTAALHRSLMRIALLMRQSALLNRCEVVWHAWEWLIGLDDATYMADTTHPSAAGYDEFVRYLRHYLRGGSTAVNRIADPESIIRTGFAAHASGYVDLSLVDGWVTIQGRISKTAAGTSGSANFVGDIDQPLQLPRWAAAVRGEAWRPLVGFLGANRDPIGLALFGLNGQDRLTVRPFPTAAPTASAELHIPRQSWPIGS